MTRWFYERARGQYADAHARERTPAQAARVQSGSSPLSQKFTKTDLAKFENTWDQLPWTGLARRREELPRVHAPARAKRGSSFMPDQDYFELLVAKAILFRSTEKLVGWLQLGGYRAQTVTYTLAKLAHATEQRIDLRAIWRAQELPAPLVEADRDLAPRVHAALFESAGSRNISEWAKKEDCWKAIQAIDWTPGAALPASSSKAASAPDDHRRQRQRSAER